jgi:hypothetical protein
MNPGIEYNLFYLKVGPENKPIGLFSGELAAESDLIEFVSDSLGMPTAAQFLQKNAEYLSTLQSGAETKALRSPERVTPKCPVPI